MDLNLHIDYNTFNHSALTGLKELTISNLSQKLETHREIIINWLKKQQKRQLMTLEIRTFALNYQLIQLLKEVQNTVHTLKIRLTYQPHLDSDILYTLLENGLQPKKLMIDKLLIDETSDVENIVELMKFTKLSFSHENHNFILKLNSVNQLPQVEMLTNHLYNLRLVIGKVKTNNIAEKVFHYYIEKDYSSSKIEELTLIFTTQISY